MQQQHIAEVFWSWINMSESIRWGAPSGECKVLIHIINVSVLWHGGIYLVRPSQDSTFQIQDFPEPGLSQEIDSFCGTLSATAVRDNLTRRVQFVDAARQFPQRDQVPAQVADLILVWFANV